MVIGNIIFDSRLVRVSVGGRESTWSISCREIYNVCCDSLLLPRVGGSVETEWSVV